MDKRSLADELRSLADRLDATEILDTQETVEDLELRGDDKHVIAEAWTSDEDWSLLGSELAKRVTIAANRDGFMRRIVLHEDLDQDQNPSALEKYNAERIAVVENLDTVSIHDKSPVPPEFQVECFPFVEGKDKESSPLERIYVSVLTGTMVPEDKVWLRAVDEGMPRSHCLYMVGDRFTPKRFMKVVDRIAKRGFVPSSALISSSLWVEAGRMKKWADIMDPVTKNEFFMSGKLGRVHSIDLYTDFVRHPQHKVLADGEFYVFSIPEQHGQYTDRGGFASLATAKDKWLIPGKGWRVGESLSLAIREGSAAKGVMLD